MCMQLAHRRDADRRGPVLSTLAAAPQMPNLASRLVGVLCKWHCPTQSAMLIQHSRAWADRAMCMQLAHRRDADRRGQVLSTLAAAHPPVTANGRKLLTPGILDSLATEFAPLAGHGEALSQCQVFSPIYPSSSGA